ANDMDIVSNAEGRLTLPAEIRETLHVEGETRWTVEVQGGAVILRPAGPAARDVAWADTAAFRAQVARARQQAREGRAYRATSADFEDLMAGRVTVQELEARLEARGAAEAVDA